MFFGIMYPEKAKVFVCAAKGGLDTKGKIRAMAQELATAERLTQARDFLLDALGDHMVASTVFAKCFPLIYREIAAGGNPADVARSIWDTDFAGDDGYESV